MESVIKIDRRNDAFSIRSKQTKQEKNKETWRRQADRCGSQAHFCF